MRGAAATGAQHTREREPLRIESQLGFGALQAVSKFGVQGVPNIRTIEIKQKISLWVRLLPNWSALSARARRRRGKLAYQRYGGSHMVTSSLRWYATGKRRIDVFPTAMSTVFLRRQKTFSLT